MAITTELRPWIGPGVVPDGWPVVGSLPSPDMTADLKAHLFSITSDDGRWVINVGWEEEEDPNGKYVLRMSVNGFFKYRMETRTVHDLRLWVIDAVNTALNQQRSLKGG